MRTPPASILRLHQPLPAGVEPSIRPLVSDVPMWRLEQSKAFWRRNPGYFRILAAEDAVRGVIEMLPGGSWLNRMIAPTVHGYGQLMIDQMSWQIRSRRQPDNVWWMTMNARLVGDGITAEAYLRAGRAHELTAPQYHAWLNYIRLSDIVRAKAARPQGLLDAIEAVLVWRPAARHAYWKAHDESIQASKAESVDVLRRVNATNPREAEFSSAWARTITLFRIINPIATGRLALTVQRWFLPQYQPVDGGSPSLSQRVFMRLIQLADSTYEEAMSPSGREKVPGSGTGS